MIDWLKNNLFVIIALLTILVGGAIAHGQAQAKLDRLEIIEARQIEMLDRLSHLEGRYFAQELNE